MNEKHLPAIRIDALVPLAFRFRIGWWVGSVGVVLYAWLECAV